MNKVLVIDPDEGIRGSLKTFLNQLEYTVILANSGKQGISLFEKEEPDLVITALEMDDIDGIEILKTIKKIESNTQVIIITSIDDMNSIILAMQNGAYDFLSKPLDLQKFKFIIQRALETSLLSKKLELVNINLTDKDNYNLIVGRSPQIKEIIKKIGQISINKVNVLIQGESGTGKELISRVIHNSGITKGQPFIAVNSAALPETLLETELFGHEKGAFTGAVRSKKGKFELAGEGTIFLDEISEMSLNLQTKLLRVIQEREFIRVGGEETIPMKARIIVATNQNLQKLVEERKFREDLYYRIKVFSIYVPPLRERKEDIPILIVHFLQKINRELHKNVRKVPYEVLDMLQQYNWVGNVRELENVLLQAVVLAKGEAVEKENIMLKSKDKQIIIEERDDYSLESVEKKHIVNVLEKVKGDKHEAAKLLKISRQTLYNKIKAFSIDTKFSE